jgi:hypothetical protein
MAYICTIPFESLLCILQVQFRKHLHIYSSRIPTVHRAIEITINAINMSRFPVKPSTTKEQRGAADQMKCCPYYLRAFLNYTINYNEQDAYKFAAIIGLLLYLVGCWMITSVPMATIGKLFACYVTWPVCIKTPHTELQSTPINQV